MRTIVPQAQASTFVQYIPQPTDSVKPSKARRRKSPLVEFHMSTTQSSKQPSHPSPTQTDTSFPILTLPVSLSTASTSGTQDSPLSPPLSAKSGKESSLVKRTPSSAKSFQCKGYGDCKMVFSRCEHLARHIRKHTGERPFTCHCSKQFSRLDNLRQHAQTVHSDKQPENEEMMRRLTTAHSRTLTAGTPIMRAHPQQASSHQLPRIQSAPNDHHHVVSGPSHQIHPAHSGHHPSHPVHPLSHDPVTFSIPLRPLPPIEYGGYMSHNMQQSQQHQQYSYPSMIPPQSINRPVS